MLSCQRDLNYLQVHNYYFDNSQIKTVVLQNNVVYLNNSIEHTRRSLDNLRYALPLKLLWCYHLG